MCPQRGSIPPAHKTRHGLVTGASGGVGAGIARRLWEAGAAVVVHYRCDADGAAAVVDAMGAARSRASRQVPFRVSHLHAARHQAWTTGPATERIEPAGGANPRTTPRQSRAPRHRASRGQHLRRRVGPDPRSTVEIDEQKQGRPGRALVAIGQRMIPSKAAREHCRLVVRVRIEVLVAVARLRRMQR